MIILDVAGWIVQVLALGVGFLIWSIAIGIMAVVVSVTIQAIKRSG